MPDATWRHRHLLGLQGLTADDLRTFLRAARSFNDAVARDAGARLTVLRGRSVANLFFEDSTRTRIAFTVAAQRLGADAVDLTGSGSSVSKGETITDTALNVEAMGVDALVVRHKAAGAPALIARSVRCAVINAGDGKHEHPTQGLLDAYTLAEAHGRLDSFDLTGLRVAIVGDVISSRVARSNIIALRALGASVVCVGPPTLAPRSLEVLGCDVSHDLDAVLADVDALNMLRIQFERHDAAASRAAAQPSAAHAGMPAAASPSFPSVREYTAAFGLTAARAAKMKKAAVVMHPGPLNRGIEIESGVADGPRSMILRQVSNGLGVRMAALALSVSASA